MVPILVLITFIVIITIFVLIKDEKAKKSTEDIFELDKPEFSLMLPANYLLFRNHIWLKKEEDNTYLLGLDELFHNFVGIPDEIYLKNRDDRIKKGQQLAVLKTGSKEVYVQAPVDLTIKKPNDTVSIQTDLINEGPYDHGWLYKIENVELGTEEAVKIGIHAQRWLTDEFNRMKEFLIGYANQPVPRYNTLMDGGVPVKGVIKYLDQYTVTIFEQEFLRIENNIILK